MEKLKYPLRESSLITKQETLQDGVNMEHLNDLHKSHLEIKQPIKE